MTTMTSFEGHPSTPSTAPFILWLGEPGSDIPAYTGNKAATLSRLAAHYPVPMGFCITAAAFADGDPVVTTLAPQVEAAIALAYQRMAESLGGQEPAVAVRSSAIGEDGQHDSFAGQLESFLDRRGVHDLVDAVWACYQSAFGERAQTYRAERHLALAGVSVLVQVMVPADAAAIAFSLDPVSGDDAHISITAARGLGSVLADGTTEPDVYRVEKTSVADSASGLHYSATLATDTAVLDASQIGQVAQLALSLEAEFGLPVDVECAFARGALHLLQCRPVTTTAQSHSLPADDKAGWQFIGRTFPEPLSPLTQSYLPLLPLGWQRNTRANSTNGELHIRFIDGYYHAKWQPGPAAPGQPRETAEARTWALQTNIAQRWYNEFLPKLQADHARVRALPLAELSPEALAEHLQRILLDQIEHFTMHAHIVTSAYGAVERLTGWYERRFPNALKAEPYRLLQGLPNAVTRIAQRVWAAAHTLTAEDMAALQTQNTSALSETASASWRALLQDFGHVTQRPMDPSTPIWLEDPSYLANWIAASAAPNTPNPSADLAREAEDRATFAQVVRNRLQPGERDLFEQLLTNAIAAYPLVEDHNQAIDYASAADVRVVVVALAQHMLAAQALATLDDVAYVRLDELIAWGYGLRDSLHERIASRRNEIATQRLSRPASMPDHADAQVLRGLGASAGRVRGVVRVVRNADDARLLQKGEILVCVAPEPAWTPLFALAAALVCDTGGPLSHAAIIAREFRIPAVVATHQATARLHTGQTVEVNGATGVVKVV